MKATLLALALLAASSALGQSPAPAAPVATAPPPLSAAVQRWKDDEALCFKICERLFPDLQRVGSRLNTDVQARIALLDKAKSNIFDRPDWLSIIINQVRQEWASQPAQPVPQQAAAPPTAAAPKPKLTAEDRLLLWGDQSEQDGETYDQWLARRQKMADLGFLGPVRGRYSDPAVEAQAQAQDREDIARAKRRYIASRLGVDITTQEELWKIENSQNDLKAQLDDLYSSLPPPPDFLLPRNHN